MDAAHWHMTFRVRSASAALLGPRVLRDWWSAFPDQPGNLLTDGTLLLDVHVEAADARHALLLGRHRVTEFFPGQRYRLEPLTMQHDDW